MKPTLFSLLLVTALLPAIALAAPREKGKKRPAAARQGGDLGETLKTFDKNENHQIDADELPALQKAFSALKNLDKNSNGEIEQSEVDTLKARSREAGRGRMFAGLRDADKNGNRKIDPEEIEGLQKALAGSPLLSRLDQNGNGKLEPGEVERLNQRIAQGVRKRPGAADPAPAPSVRKPPAEKPAEASPPAEKPNTEAEEKKDEKPATPAPETKTPGNFGS